MIPWKELSSIEQLEEAINNSNDFPIAIYKHSTRCGTSYLVKNRLERNWDSNQEDPIFFYVDVIGNRSVSNQIESLLSIRHESPQLIIISNGEVIHHASHMAISSNDIQKVNS